MSILTVMLIVIFVLVVIPLLYWVGLGLNQVIRQLTRHGRRGA